MVTRSLPNTGRSLRAHREPNSPIVFRDRSKSFAQVRDVGCKINALDALRLAEQVVNAGHRVEPVLSLFKQGPHGSVRLPPSLNGEEGRGHSKAILRPMVDLGEQHVPLSQKLAQLLAERLLTSRWTLQSRAFAPLLASPTPR